MFPLAFIAGWLQGHWWGFISRNYVVWPTFLLMNVFVALKGSHFWFLFILGKLNLCLKLTPTYISENFTSRNHVTNTTMLLRSSTAGCFVPPKPRTEYFKHSVRYSGYLVWNSLPQEVKNAQTPETFHNSCLKWLMNWTDVNSMNLTSNAFFFFNLFFFLLYCWTV